MPGVHFALLPCDESPSPTLITFSDSLEVGASESLFLCFLPKLWEIIYDASLLKGISNGLSRSPSRTDRQTDGCTDVLRGLIGPAGE